MEAAMAAATMVVVAATSRLNFKQRLIYRNNGCELMSLFEGVDCYYFVSVFFFIFSTKWLGYKSKKAIETKTAIDHEASIR